MSSQECLFLRVLLLSYSNAKSAFDEDCQVLQSCITWLDNYFHSPGNLKDVPAVRVCHELIGGPLQSRASTCDDINFFTAVPAFYRKCMTLLPVIATFGRVVSYAQLAAAAGSEKARRAAGAAMRNNPLMILVPCHRVITKGGCIGKFSGGTRQKVKKWLLEHEYRLC